MVTDVRIPRLGVTMTEGVLSAWLVGDGAPVGADAALYVLETDKVENEIPSPAAGTLRHIGIEGEIYRVGELIAEILS